MAFVDLWSEVAARIPSLSPLLAPKFVNRAWREIRNRRTWSFQYMPALFAAPPILSAGTVTLTQGSTAVGCDASAAAILEANKATLPGRQLRVNNAGPIYSIASWTSPAGPLVLTLPWTDPSTVTGTWMVYQVYFPAPSTDFTRWVSIYCPNEGYAFKSLTMNQKVLDMKDPMRQNQGQPYWASPLMLGADGRFLYEFWPSPSVQQTYVSLYVRSGLDMVNDTDPLPAVISDECVVERALYHAYKWATANVGRLPALKGVNWGFLMNDHTKSWERDYLQPCRRQDDNIRSNSLIIQGKSLYRGPVDGAFLQGHTGLFWNWP